jgi:hypothetical protein
MRGTWEWALCRNSQNSGRAPAVDRTMARKTLSIPNGFRQSFRARATPRTPDKPGSPPALRTSPLSLLYKEWTWEHYMMLNLTFFASSARRYMGGIYRRWGGSPPQTRGSLELSYPVFMPKRSSHHMHDPGSIVPHIRPKVFTDNQMSLIKYNYYISSVSKDYDDSQWNRIVENSITP